MPYVFPIVGGRKVEHLHANLEALDVALTDAHIRRIETAVPFELGVPHDLAVSLPAPLLSPGLLLLSVESLLTCGDGQGDGTFYNYGWTSAGQFDMWPQRQAIRPSGSS